MSDFGCFSERVFKYSGIVGRPAFGCPWHLQLGGDERLVRYFPPEYDEVEAFGQALCCQGLQRDVASSERCHDSWEGYCRKRGKSGQIFDVSHRDDGRTGFSEPRSCDAVKFICTRGPNILYLGLRVIRDAPSFGTGRPG